MPASKSIFFIFAVNIKCQIWEKDLSGLDGPFSEMQEDGFVYI